MIWNLVIKTVTDCITCSESRDSDSVNRLKSKGILRKGDKFLYIPTGTFVCFGRLLQHGFGDREAISLSPRDLFRDWSGFRNSSSPGPLLISLYHLDIAWCLHSLRMGLTNCLTSPKNTVCVARIISCLMSISHQQTRSMNTTNTTVSTFPLNRINLWTLRHS